MTRFAAYVAALSLLARGALAQTLSALTEAPRWEQLEPFQETITQPDFQRLLDEVYAPHQAWMETLSFGENDVRIKTTLQPEQEFTLRFAAAGQEKPAPRSWRPASALGPAPAEQPMRGVKVALDPGHIGGAWSRMEERFYQLGESRPVEEGNMSLRVAQLLAPQLEKMGAEVSWVRASTEPVTPLRPKDFLAEARQELLAEGHAQPRETYDGPNDPHRAGTVQIQSEILFYRTSEIHYRAQRVNEQLRPDLTLCLHFDAKSWGDPKRPSFVSSNHLHFLINGCYDAGDLRKDDLRFEMLHRLLSRTLPEEQAASEAVAVTFSKAAGLPAFAYGTPNAVRAPGSEFVWARNLLANRLFHTPVVFIEPYVMNNELVWKRVQLGDYEGEIVVGGLPRKSIYREYADAVAEGLRNYYLQTRGTIQAP